MRDTCALKSRLEASATATFSQKKAFGLEFSIRAFQGTKSRASSTRLAPVFPRGRRGSASVSAGMAARTIRVASAGAEIFAIAGI